MTERRTPVVKPDDQVTASVKSPVETRTMDVVTYLRRRKLLYNLGLWAFLDAVGFGALAWELTDRKWELNRLFDIEGMDSFLMHCTFRTLYWCACMKALAVSAYTILNKDESKGRGRFEQFVRLWPDRPSALLDAIALVIMPTVAAIGSGGFGYAITGTWPFKNEAPTGYDRWFELRMSLKLGILTTIAVLPTVLVSGRTLSRRHVTPRFTLYIPEHDRNCSGLFQPANIVQIPLFAYGGLFLGGLATVWNASIELGGNHLNLNYQGFPGIPLVFFAIAGMLGAMWCLFLIVVSWANIRRNFSQK